MDTELSRFHDALSRGVSAYGVEVDSKRTAYGERFGFSLIDRHGQSITRCAWYSPRGVRSSQNLASVVRNAIDYLERNGFEPIEAEVRS